MEFPPMTLQSKMEKCRPFRARLQERIDREFRGTIVVFMEVVYISDGDCSGCSWAVIDPKQ